jgi:hypothetical protein
MVSEKKKMIDKWDKVSQDVLQGRTIVEVRYLNDEEMEMMGFYSRPICFILDNGTYCTLSSYDEGNDGGVLFYNENGVLPTL